MTHAEHLILVGICGGIVGVCGCIAAHDWNMSAHAGERKACKERPDSAAYYMRKPGESHSVETCQFVPRYGDPAWIPYMSHPLKPK